MAATSGARCPRRRPKSSTSGGSAVPTPATAVASRRAAARVTFQAPPGQMQMRLSVEGAAGQVLDTDFRDLVVPDYTKAEPLLSVPAVFRARTVRDMSQLAANPEARPTTSREFSRTERLLFRVRAYAPGGGAAGAGLEAAQSRGEQDGGRPGQAGAIARGERVRGRIAARQPARGRVPRRGLPRCRREAGEAATWRFALPASVGTFVLFAPMGSRLARLRGRGWGRDSGAAATTGFSPARTAVTATGAQSAFPARLDSYLRSIVQPDAAGTAGAACRHARQPAARCDPGTEVAVFGSVWVAARPSSTSPAVNDIEQLRARGATFAVTKRLAESADARGLRPPRSAGRRRGGAAAVQGGRVRRSS